MKDLPFWLPKKNTLVWYLLFIGLFLLSLDFWNWGSSTPVLLGLPLWMWHLFGLTIVLPGAYYAFSRFFWREDE